MIYESDPELPFMKIIVKRDSSCVGIIRRNLKTGVYLFFDNLSEGFNPLLQGNRIDKMKLRIEELYSVRETEPIHPPEKWSLLETQTV